MKDFFKQVSATVVGLIVFFLIMGVIGAMSLVGMVASEQATKNVGDNSVLVLNLAGVMGERNEGNILSRLTGNSLNNLALEDIVSAIKKAKDNENIKGIYIEAGALQANGYASLEEIRNALKDFKQSKKWIFAYADSYSQGAYYVASVADKIIINPQGMLDWHGLVSQPMFYKDLYAKFGVRYQVVKVGTYKSYTEAYTEEKMSDANRAQVTAFVNGTWWNICKAVSDSRKISVDSLNAYADRMGVFETADNLKRYKMVDEVMYADEVKDLVKKQLGIDADKKIKQISVGDMRNVKEKRAGGEEIAVYYAYGSIVGADAGGLTGSGNEIVGQKVVEDLDRLAADDNIKAVVLRINSGGGSAFASEQMWHAVRLLREKKPVVVSMGGMAASGGYYMSCGADYIVAEPTTLTGSIGIFGMIPDATGLLTGKLGLHFDVVKTNEASDFGNLGRSFNAAESAAMQAYVNRGYALFLSRVATGRRMTTTQVDSIAQGRVWTGRQALRLGLVDKLGSLDVAIEEAARRAGVKDYAVCTAPQEEDWLSSLLNDYQSDYMERRVSEVLGEYYEPLRFVGTLRGTDCLQARLPFAPNLR